MWWHFSNNTVVNCISCRWSIEPFHSNLRLSLSLFSCTCIIELCTKQSDTSHNLLWFILAYSVPFPYQSLDTIFFLYRTFAHRCRQKWIRSRGGQDINPCISTGHEYLSAFIRLCVLRWRSIFSDFVQFALNQCVEIGTCKRRLLRRQNDKLLNIRIIRVIYHIDFSLIWIRKSKVQTAVLDAKRHNESHKWFFSSLHRTRYISDTIF